MKIALAQQNYHIGNFESNVKKIKTAIALAKSAKADLVVFPELAVCGYPPKDFLQFNDFIAKCRSSVEEIASECIGIAAIIGGPSVNPQKEGKPLYNSGYFLEDGEIRTVVHKALLPTYDVFDESRYFEAGREFNIIEYKGKRIALTICEDLWDEYTRKTEILPAGEVTQIPLTDEKIIKMYTVSPMDQLKKQSPDIMINIAASPFSYTHAAERKTVLIRNASEYKLPLFYVNHAGAQTDLIFDGGSIVLDAAGNIIDELAYFLKDFKVYDTDRLIPMPETSTPSSIALIHDALVLGIKDYFEKLGFRKAILGLSGGIDSAVVLALAVSALGHENVRAVLMPSQYSSDHSVNDAVALAKNLDVKYDIINIKDIYNALESTLEPYFEGLPANVAEENLQARTRGVLLMGMSNKFGYVLLNTSNKSELSVGYGTLYGDMCGGISVLGDVYKMQIFELARYINSEKEIIPENTITKPPSAELRPDQKDSDSLPEYDILDAILFQYIENFKGPSEIISMGYEKSLVERILKMVNTNEYKRHQGPPILRVSGKAFGSGRRIPIVGKYLS